MIESHTKLIIDTIILKAISWMLLWTMEIFFKILAVFIRSTLKYTYIKYTALSISWTFKSFINKPSTASKHEHFQFEKKTRTHTFTWEMNVEKESTQIQQRMANMRKMYGRLMLECFTISILGVNVKICILRQYKELN